MLGFNSRPRTGESAAPGSSSNSHLGPASRDRRTGASSPAASSLQPPAAPEEETLEVPNRTSSLHSRIVQPMPAALTQPRAGQRAPKTLTHAYMVCGVGREPSQWVRAPTPVQGRIGHMKGAVGQFWLPEILGSSPRLEQDNDVARSLHAAMRACFPHDVEICTGNNQPHCVHHAFVLQQDSSHTLYGIALRVWSKADDKRAETIRELRKRTEVDYYDQPGETYWIPYCLSFLSRYPLYNLLGDYLRGMWIHWNKATNLFHAEEVSRILSFPAPRLNDLVRIDMKDYALCYQFPSAPTQFQNFALWPLFSCLSIPNIVGVLEAAVSPTRRIIFISHYPAMLTVATETVRFLVRGYEWSGLYVPVAHARHARELVQEPGPYILGMTSECRTLFTAPADALVIDLDRNFVLTSSPPTAWNARQRTKLINRMTQALNGDVAPSGVPQHLRSAYGGGKLIPAGQIIVMRGEVEAVQDPSWWNQEEVMRVMDHACSKLGKNTGLKAVIGGSQKKPLMTKVSMRHLNEIVRERNQYSRDAMEAWQDFINLKGRMDTELAKVSKRNNFLVEELESWKQQFLKFQKFAEELTKQTNELKVKIDGHKRENKRLTSLIDQQKDDIQRITNRMGSTEKQRDDALEALVLQQEIAEELERERKRNKKDLSALQHTNTTLLRQRDEAQRVVLHLRALIEGQSSHMQHIVKGLKDTPEFLDTSEEQTAEAGATESTSATASSSRIVESPAGYRSINSRTSSRASTSSSSGLDNSRRPSKRFSDLSMTDVADRQLRDKTDAIAYIIRNISEQCAAAVDSLEFVKRADTTASSEDGDEFKDSSSQAGSASGNTSRNSRRLSRQRPTRSLLSPESVLGASNNSPHKDDDNTSVHGSDTSEFNDSKSERSAISSVPSYSQLRSSQRTSSMVAPPTPDLVHDRSSTSMSLASESMSTMTPIRHSMASNAIHDEAGIVDADTVAAVGAAIALDVVHEDEPQTKFQMNRTPIDRHAAEA